MIKKYKYEKIDFEITRKCNRQCPICMRGEAQDCTITKDIINKVFSGVEDCTFVSLLGGESLLEIDMVEYLIQKIISSNWDIKGFQLTTNGSIIDEKIIIALEKLCEHKSNCNVLFRISADQFHNMDNSKLAYEKYVSFTKNKRIEIILKDKINSFKCSGYGAKYLQKNPSKKIDGVIGVDVPNVQNHRIKVVGDMVFCPFQISANGNVSRSKEISYIELDKIAIGNIKSETLTDMITRNNDKCLLACCDWDNIRSLKAITSEYNRVYTDSNNFDMVYVISQYIFDKIYEYRQLAHKLYPLVTAQDIIVNLPMPKDYILEIKNEISGICQHVMFSDCYINKSKWLKFLFNSDKMLFNLYYKNLSKHTDDAQINFTAYLFLLHPEIVKDSILKAINNSTKFFRLLTTSKIKDTPEFDKLKKLNEMYKSGTLTPKNDKVLPCNIGESLVEGEPNLFDAVFNVLDEKYNSNK